jgi:hypothetical protein
VGPKGLSHLSCPLLFWQLLGVSTLVWLSLCLTCPNWSFPFCGPSQSRLITSNLKLETSLFSKMLASTNQSTWHHNPKEYNQNCHCHENLKSNIVPFSSEFCNSHCIVNWPSKEATVYSFPVWGLKILEDSMFVCLYWTCKYHVYSFMMFLFNILYR